jgi:tryptophan synthase alpha chain
MNRIDRLFENKESNILSIYFTAGYPEIDNTVSIVKLLEQHGADMLEIGMPFSDPLADGPVIQQSSHQAIENGMSIRLLFEQLSDIRKDVDIPLILMGYLNPVMQFGIEQFCKKCHETGIDGIILPDLPMKDYLETYKAIFERYNLYNIFLITPQTTKDRIRLIDENSHGFIYMVSSSSTTGVKGQFTEEQISYFDRIRAMNLKNPRIIGFGISDAHSFSKACEYANGAIVGSAFIRALEGEGDLQDKIKGFFDRLLLTEPQPGS